MDQTGSEGLKNIDTICALSTPYGRSAIGVIRISGQKTRFLLKKLIGKIPPPRKACFVVVRDKSGLAIDEVITTFYPQPKSYTGEDLAEIGVHGNPKILNEILKEIVSHETRLAEPGEFTQRALAHGKLTLDQVESLDCLINSETLEGSRLALQAKMKGLGCSVEKFSKELLKLISNIQAQLDFSEEEVEEITTKEIIYALNGLIEELDGWLKAFCANKALFERWTVALVGPPNSGKSSLFNILSGSSRAIVYDQPGTTRDSLETAIEQDGVCLLLVDTAGIRETTEPIETMGIQKTYERIKTADVVCWISDQGLKPTKKLMNEFYDKKWILISSKADLSPPIIPKSIPVSVITQEGLKELKKAILPERTADFNYRIDLPILTSERQNNLVKQAKEALVCAMVMLEEGYFLDLIACEVLKANESLDEIVKKLPSEAVLKEIFSRFCIGK